MSTDRNVRRLFAALRKQEMAREKDRILNTLLAEQIIASRLSQKQKMAALLDIIAGRNGVHARHKLELSSEVNRALVEADTVAASEPATPEGKQP